MPIKKYKANADNIITNTLQSATSTSRRTGSNAGASDILQVYSIYGRQNLAGTASAELTRTLIKFPVDDIKSDRDAGLIPASGSVTFKLKMYNAKHYYALPFGYDIQVAAVTGSWEEGYGIDLQSYTDETSDGIGSNWMNKSGDNIISTTAVTFNSGSKNAYSASTGVNYLTIYNGSIPYQFWFYSGSTDTAGSLSRPIKVDVSGSKIIRHTTAVTFSSDSTGDYNADGGANYLSIYNGGTQYGVWFYTSSADTVPSLSDTIKVDIGKRITAVSFSSDTKDDYNAETGTNYVSIYDAGTQYGFWFYTSSTDTAAGITNQVKVDVSDGCNCTRTNFATEFQSTINAHSAFSANISGNVVYVTASTSGPSTATSTAGTLSGISYSVASEASSSIMKIFHSTVNSHAAFSANISGTIVFVTASASGSMVAASTVGTLGGLTPSTYWTPKTSFAIQFHSAASEHGAFSANRSGEVVTVTASTSGKSVESTISGTMEGLTISQAQAGVSGTKWTLPGGDYFTDDSSSFTQTISKGNEHLDIDITPLVEQWIDSDGNVLGDKINDGIIIKTAQDYEPYYSSSASGDAAIKAQELVDGILHHTGGVRKSYFTKMFFGRATEFYYLQPCIEAQYEDVVKDDRNKFTISSSVKPTFSDNLNRLYFYNYYNSQLVDIGNATTNVPTASLYYSSGTIPEGTARGFLNSDGTAVASLKSTRSSKGVYYVEVATTKSVVTSTYPYLVDVWSFGGEQVLTGSAFEPKVFNPSTEPVNSTYVLSMPNLMPEYNKEQTPRLRLYVRSKSWSPNIYTVAKSKPESLTMVSASYRVLRVVDEYEVIPYGTGSVKYTSLSYDGSGNYFDLPMTVFEAGYQYALKYSFYDGYTKSYIEQPYEFKFRVVE